MDNHSDALNVVRSLVRFRSKFDGYGGVIETVIAQRSILKYSLGSADIHAKYRLQFTFNHKPDQRIVIEDSSVMRIWRMACDWTLPYVRIEGMGTGQAVVQMSLTKNVQYEWQLRQDNDERLQLNVSVVGSHRNFSRLLYTPCFSCFSQCIGRRIAFELRIPSGYVIDQGRLGENAWWDYNSGLVSFVFNHISNNEQCWTFKADRLVPVSNLTRYYSIRAFDLNEPSFARRSVYTVRSLYGLDVCQSCGSYQCPYCPFYASTQTIQSSLIILVLIMLLTVLDFGRVLNTRRRRRREIASDRLTHGEMQRRREARAQTVATARAPFV
ncbi:hypothetical protein ACOME3_008447 [Neoechinorhynchus agilis]